MTRNDCSKIIKGHEICVSMVDYKARCPECARRYDDENTKNNL